MLIIHDVMLFIISDPVANRAHIARNVISDRLIADSFFVFDNDRPSLLSAEMGVGMRVVIGE